MKASQEGTRARRLLLLSAVFVAGCTAPPARQDAEVLRRVRAADANYQAGELVAAKKEYEKLLTVSPAYATAHVQLGASAFREGDAATAQTEFELALRKDPKNAQATWNLARGGH